MSPPIVWKKPVLIRDESRLTLRWDYQETALQSFRLYAGHQDTRPVLYKTLPGDAREYSEGLVPGKKYRYLMIAVFDDGKMSEMSEPLDFQY